METFIPKGFYKEADFEIKSQFIKYDENEFSIRIIEVINCNSRIFL
ncbi:MAG: hypothetical protein ACK4GR_00210 [bacterium]